MSSATLRIALIALSLFSTLGCFNSGGGSPVFRQDSMKCAASAIPNQYIVHWINGKSEVFKGMTREELTKKIIEPNLHLIRMVDSDRHLEVPRAQAVSTAEFADWGVAESGAPVAWENSIFGEGARVAVIDTGIDYNHLQLRDQIDFNLGEEGNDSDGNDKRFNLIDDDENGYVDDWLGYNFAYNDGNPDDSGLHGTHVSGIIAAEHFDGVEVMGVAPKAKIIPIAFIGQSDRGDLGAALKAMDYAAVRGANVVNASWGGVACAPALGEKIQELNSKGIIFVAASGNSGLNIELNPEFPAGFNAPLQVTVGSIGRALGMAEHSNFGNKLVHIFSPGVEILSTLPGNSYGAMTGTSMAAPFVSGALALLKSFRPTATPQELRQALLTGVSKDRDYANSTDGRLNIQKALSKLEQLVPQTNTP